MILLFLKINNSMGYWWLVVIVVHKVGEALIASASRPKTLELNWTYGGMELKYKKLRLYYLY